MATKRIIGAVIIKDGLAVQSFNFNNYLPLGDPIILIENLDRWGADEILILDIDRSRNNLGPNFDFLENLSKFKIKTPLIYGGGIKNKFDAIDVVQKGIERIVIDQWLNSNFNEVKELSSILGRQAIITCFPLSIKKDEIKYYNYLNYKHTSISKSFMTDLKKVSSEILVIDYKNEGSFGNFNVDLINKLLPVYNLEMIAFGGISPQQINNLLSIKEISAICIGNYLNYKEHNIQLLKQSLKNKNIRPEKFLKEI